MSSSINLTNWTIKTPVLTMMITCHVVLHVLYCGTNWMVEGKLRM